MKILKLFLIWLLPLQLFSCGGDLKPCKGKVDCDEGKDCLYIHAGKDGYFCVKQCKTDADCDAWEECRGVATSCMQCFDDLEVCL